MHSKKTLSEIIKGFLPNFVFWCYMFVMYMYSDLLWSSPSIIILNISPFFTLCLARLIVCTVGKKTFNLLEDLHLSIPILASLVIFPLNKILGLGLNEPLVFTILICANFFVYFLYIINTINQIKQCLGIWVFSLKKPNQSLID